MSHAARLLLPSLLLACAVPAQEEQRILRTQFDRFDADKNGGVSKEEFPGSDKQFASIDQDRNGQVSFEEYARSAVAKMLLAARNREAMPPRERRDPVELTYQRLQQLSRFDPNRDGRLRRAEWTGTPEAFTSLDLDRNEVIDSKDRALAKRQRDESREASAMSLYEQFTTRLPAPEQILQRFDQNGDELLTRAEAASADFAVLFPAADRNLDELLDLYELRVMVGVVNTRLLRQSLGNEKPRAYLVPFSTWDQNDDGRLDTGEWRERKELFPRIDTDRDGFVTKTEVERYKRSVEGADFVEKFDLDGDRAVTPAEFGGPPDAFRRADRNGDGVISRGDR